MDGGSSYGLLIGGDGAQVVGIGARHSGTSDITISNVEIYGIYNQVWFLMHVFCLNFYALFYVKNIGD